MGLTLYQEFGRATLAILAGILFYVVSATIYRAIYKAERDRSHMFEVVLQKTRLFVYLTLFAVAVGVSVDLWPEVPHLAQVREWTTVVMLVLVGIVFIEGINAFFFDYLLPDRRGVEVPSIYRDLVRVIMYLAGTLSLLNYIVGLNVGPLVTGSAIISIVIGLALQESLGNFFSGIFLHGSKPFSRGDWVKFGPAEGVVEKIDWRATAIRTNYGDYVIYPNSTLAKMEIVNYSAPTKLSARSIHVGVAYRHAPAKVKRVLIDSALKTARVHADPRPVGRIIKFGDFAVEYELKFWITEFGSYPDIVADVMERVWYSFKREDIDIPFPTQHTYIFRHHQPQDAEAITLKLLKHIDFLADFPEEAMRYLASRAKVLTFTHGEPIIRQGDQGNSFYVVKDGKVQVQARNADGELFFTKDLHKGQFFGEMALLTGEPRSATVVALEESELLRLDKDAFRKIIDDNPRADELIGEALARRKEYSEEKTAAGARQSSATDGESTGARQVLIKRIRDFFSY